MCNPPRENAQYAAGAPTFPQVRRIFFDDMISKLKPIITDVNKSELRIEVMTGASLTLVGLDKPERIEGVPWSGIGVTEIASVKPDALFSNLIPALDTPGVYGWGQFEGVPEGRNYMYDLVKRIQGGQLGDSWGYYHWLSADILPKEIIDQARANLDELTFKQEYEAAFVNFIGLCYYAWTDANVRPCRYDPDKSLHFCFDFNVSPGIAIAIQQFDDGDYVVGEVHIPRNSNTEMVCNRLISMYTAHIGHVYLYGDATGESRKSSGIVGTDWHIIRNMLSEGIKESTIIPRIPKANPRERARINAMNSRLKDGSGEKHFFVDPSCVNTIRDFEGVQVADDGTINKKDASLTHITDAIGYYIHSLYPIGGYDPAGAFRGRVVIGQGTNFNDN